MRAINKKLYRDLWHMRGQVIAVALVIASGVAVLSMSLSTTEALEETAQAYYERYRFAHVFANVKRAPEYLADRIRLLPGVQSVSTRVVQTAVVDITGFEEPIIGQLVSIPERGEPELNALALQAGRFPQVGRPDEAIMSSPFAEAHGLRPGDRFRAILNGNWRELEIVGIALSPEFVYTIGPGALMPDNQRFGIIWMGQQALQAAYDLDGAFNDISVGLLRGTDPDPVIQQMDEMLKDYGGFGAIKRADQLSNWFLMNEIKQLNTMSRVLPTMFLIVAAFLTNMVLARLIMVERSEIGLLKAFGYSNFEIGMHYFRLTLVITLLGILIGSLAGYAFGYSNTKIYAEFYSFPFLLYSPGPFSFGIAAIASIIAAMLGALNTVRNVAKLPPGEAMRPPAPTNFRRSPFSQTALFKALDQPTRILLRQIGRWPVRSFVTSAGIGMAVAVLIISFQWIDAIEKIVDVYFLQAQHSDVSVGFAETRSFEAERNLQKLPGVITTEPMRAVAAKFRFKGKEERKSLQGVPARQNLHRVFDAEGHAVNLPPDGLVISTMLSEIMGIVPGDVVTVEVLEGRRPTREIPIVGMFETYIGSPAYMDIRALNRMMGDPPSLNAVQLRTDELKRPELFRELKEIPSISSVNLKDAAVRTFHETMAESILIFVSFFVVFSCTLAFGVTYNAGRITLSERGRELATLRVLGLSKREISYILLGEIAVLTTIALPLGCMMGFGLGIVLIRAFKTELFRIPFAILPETFGLSMLIVLAATVISALVVRQRLEHLDLIAVLKTRE